ncbi:MAG: LysR family transcriptional regulator, partial [Pseudomonadota bacterium]
MTNQSDRYARPLLVSDIHRLKIFCTVVDSGGILPAATWLNVDISTVSRQIKDLEVRLGVRLCDRGRGGFSVTPEGQQVYHTARELLQNIEDSQDKIERLRNQSGGQLRIGSINHVLTNPKIQFDRVIRNLHQKSPNLDVAYNVMPSSQIVSAVLDGRIHLGITADMKRHSDLDSVKIFTEIHKLYCGKGHPLFDRRDGTISKSELKDFKYVARDHHSQSNEMADALGIGRGAVANDVEAITVLVGSGLYLGFLPEHHISAQLDRKKFRALDFPESTCPVPLYIYQNQNS